MNIQITFRNMDHSDPMEQHVRKHLEKIERFLHNERSPIAIDVFLEPSHAHRHHRVEMIVKSPNFNRTLAYEREGLDFYAVVNHVIDHMLDLLQEDHRRKIDDRKQQGRHYEFKKQR